MQNNSWIFTLHDPSNTPITNEGYNEELKNKVLSVKSSGCVILGCWGSFKVSRR